MTKETLIKKTIQSLSKLPHDKVKEVSDFADFILKKFDEEIIRTGIESLVSDSSTFDFLKTEEDLYSVDDLKERY